jgi:hypothetical protein
MMLLSLILPGMGEKIIGSAPGIPCAAGSSTRYLRSLSISRWIGCPQWPHCVVMVKLSASFRKRPCTKGVAIASIAQAASMRSPVEKAT